MGVVGTYTAASSRPVPCSRITLVTKPSVFRAELLTKPGVNFDLVLLGQHGSLIGTFKSERPGRVLRFRHFLSLVEDGRMPIAQAAAEAGYADQAHLTRECRDLSGLPPAELLAVRNVQDGA